MQPFIEDIFDKIRNTEVRTEPFDHLIVDDLLPDDFYKELSREFESERFYGNYERGPYGNIERFGADITDYPAWKNSDHRIPTTIHRRNYESLFSGESTNIQSFVNLLLENEENFYSLLCSKLPTERIQDNYFFHVSMSKDYAGYEIEPHTDATCENIYTILFYAPSTTANREFGLHVYEDSNGFPINGKKIDFLPNRMIVFAPSDTNEERPTTWHEVRRLSNKLVGTRNSFQIFFYKSANK